jgi:hypothetical protein
MIIALYSKEILRTDSYNFKRTQMVIIAYMVVRIDISNLPSHLRHTLMKEIGLSNRSRKSPDNSESKLSDIDKGRSNASDISDVIAIDDESNLHLTTCKVKDALIKNGISNYVAIGHPREERKVIIVTRDEAERRGKYHCRHCGIEFDDTVKLGVHLRLHYLIA